MRCSCHKNRMMRGNEIHFLWTRRLQFEHVDVQFCPDYYIYFYFWTSGPFMTSFDFEASNLVCYLFYRVFESLCVSYLFRDNCRFMSNCYLYLNIVSSNVISCRFVWCHVFKLLFVHDKY